jgi:hypothetical protein
MDTKDIQKRLDAMIPPMLEKGLVKPEARFSMNSDASPHLSISWDKPNRPAHSYDRNWTSGKGETIEEQFASLEACISELPGKEETKLRNFMDALGNVIDMGRANGIDVAFVNPLTETMKKLSENALTYQKEAAE